MLTPDEFPQITAHLDGAVPMIAEALPEIADPIEIIVAEPPIANGADGGVATVDASGDVRPLAAVEEDMIRLALERYSGRMTLVARKLGIGRSTLYRKLKELGISDTVSGIAAE